MTTTHRAFDVVDSMTRAAARFRERHNRVSLFRIFILIELEPGCRPQSPRLSSTLHDPTLLSPFIASMSSTWTAASSKRKKWNKNQPASEEAAANPSSSSGLYGGRRSTHCSMKRRLFGGSTVLSTKTPRSSARSSARSLVRSARTSESSSHIVCTISENLARETCVASLDVFSPTTVHVTKQSNGHVYSETLAFLQVLQPDEILLNESRQNSPLVRKIVQVWDGAESKTEGSVTTVKFLSRSCFDQTRGAEVLDSLVREFDHKLIEDFILLSATHALFHYTQLTLGATLARHSVNLVVNVGGNGRLVLDKSTLLQLELLVNAKTGKVRDSLIGSIDCTKTTVGSRLLRTNLMAPPNHVNTIHARLDLVDSLLEDENFFEDVLNNLTILPDVDRMLTNLALVPNQPVEEQDARTARKGISALVCMKSTLTALPSLVAVLQRKLDKLLEQPDEKRDDGDEATATDESSLALGLGGSGASSPPLGPHHLLRAIIFTLSHPALAELLKTINAKLTETTTYSRNAHVMRHQECFALKSDDTSLMTLLRRAFLSNVNDIYRKADEYAEAYNMRVTVKYSTARGYFLAVPREIGTDLPMAFQQPSVSGQHIHCTTEEVTCLNIRADDSYRNLLITTNTQIQDLLQTGRDQYEKVAALCDAIALLDMCQSFAERATLGGGSWCRPVVRDGLSDPRNGSLLIQKGRFAIDTSGSSSAKGPTGATYVPNDTFVDQSSRFTVVTGINGSGKSTYLRQIAMVVILGHCGSYVPAEVACIPTRDQLCTRIGNADDQESSISSFMLEMKETAVICDAVTESSLVLMDELGRATSNEDGVAIAWSVSEHLLASGAIVFFASHYSQMTEFADKHAGAQNLHLQSSISANGGIGYSHLVVKGPCTTSVDYGVELASGCGWIPAVVECAHLFERDLGAILVETSGRSNRQDADGKQALLNCNSGGATFLKLVGAIGDTLPYDEPCDPCRLRQLLGRLQASIEMFES